MQTGETIDELAARWVVRADAGSLNEGEQRELESWLVRDERHRGAFIRAQGRWVAVRRLTAIAGRGEALSSLDTPLPAPERRIDRRYLLAAGVAGVLLAAGAAWMALRPSASWYSTDVGEVRRVSLGDGSTLVLNTRSEVSVQLRDHRRDLRLIRGEALFEVARDPARPFFVQVNDVTVRAIGTAFAVRMDGTQVDVMVTEGVVEVMQPEAQADAGGSKSRDVVRRVTANQHAVVARALAPAVDAIAPRQAARQLAWQAGMVAFEGETLREAVAQVNRHNHRRIVVDDERLAEQPVVGIFKATDIEGFAATTAAALGASASVDGDTIHLRPAGIESDR